MKIEIETHCHTLATPHAFSTLQENVEMAKKIGLRALGITDHGPAAKDAPIIWHIEESRIWPKEIDGLRLLRGVEANIIDYNGTLDVEDRILSKLDLVIASYHLSTITPVNKEEHTKGYLAVAENPYVDIIGHCGYHMYPFDLDIVLPKIKETGKIIEINNRSGELRKESFDNCVEIAKKCVELDIPLVLSTDAHISYQLGHYESALKVVKAANVPEDYILNTSKEKFLDYLKTKKGKII